MPQESHSKMPPGFPTSLPPHISHCNAAISVILPLLPTIGAEIAHDVLCTASAVPAPGRLGLPRAAVGAEIAGDVHRAAVRARPSAL